VGTVATGTDGEVLRYDGRTGAFLDVFVPPGSGSRLDSSADLAFGPDGNLYVSSYDTDEVLRYDGRTGAFLDGVVPAGPPPGGRITDLVFRASTAITVPVVHEWSFEDPEMTNPAPENFAYSPAGSSWSWDHAGIMEVGSRFHGSAADGDQAAFLQNSDGLVG